MAIEEAPLMAEPAVRVPAKGVSDEHERPDLYCLSVPAALADKLQNVLTKSYSIPKVYVKTLGPGRLF